MNKAIFLDRDGTINVDKGYVYRIEDFEFLPGVVDALKLFIDMGYLLIIITNQSGIGRGYYTEEDFEKLSNSMRQKLSEEGIIVTDILYCPHLPDAKIERYQRTCNCRKPNIGLFIDAQKKWNVDLSRSYAIGDKARDCAICNNSDCRGYVIGNKDGTMIQMNRIEYRSSLLEVAKEISERESNE